MFRILAPIFLLIFACSAASAQTAATPTPKSREPALLVFPDPVLKDALAGTAQVEPVLKKFRFNADFSIGSYARPVFAGIAGHQYVWQFAEASVVLKFYETPDGTYSASSAEERKQKVDKESEASFARSNLTIVSAKDISIGPELVKDYEVSTKGVKVRVRTFVHNRVWYTIAIQPMTDDAGPLVQKLLDSFAFTADGN